jgi:pimeloyl-ACP methyl ester carboxylesterase
MKPLLRVRLIAAGSKSMSETHHVYLIPGMFGFGKLAGVDYFAHVRAALKQRFDDAGLQVVTEVAPSPPTSSLRHRARILAKTVIHTLRDEAGPVHLVGHSTGGLDSRLLLSPTTRLGIEPELLGWTHRVQSIVSVNTPHYGTPLAGYFATVSGTRMLYALSLLTIVSLSIGEPSLSVFSRLLASLGNLDSLLGEDSKWVSRVTDVILRVVDKKGRIEVSRYLQKIRSDQGGLIQIMPEAIDLFNAATEDNANVRYGCVMTAAPLPLQIKLAQRLLSPYAAVTGALFSTLYQLTSKRPHMYSYAQPTTEQQETLRWSFANTVDDRSSDGVVPSLSMLWGELLWCGEADHLDILGHFHDDQKPAKHVDWMMSGAHFTRLRFNQAMDAIAQFLLRK